MITLAPFKISYVQHHEMNPELLANSVLTILRGICLRPARDSWEKSSDKLSIDFEPTAQTDLRCCIGGGGAVIKGLQHVASVIGKLNGYRVSVHLTENLKGLDDPQDHGFVQNIGFDDNDIFKIVSNLLASSFQREVRTVRRRSNDLLELKVDVRNDGEQTIIQALSEPLYAYGFRQGCIIKLSALNHKQV